METMLRQGPRRRVVGLLPQIESTLPASRKGDPIHLAKPTIRARRVVGRFANASGRRRVKSRTDNQTHTQTCTCDICLKIINKKQISIRCNAIEHWVHHRCAGVSLQHMDLPSTQHVQVHFTKLSHHKTNTLHLHAHPHHHPLTLKYKHPPTLKYKHPHHQHKQPHLPLTQNKHQNTHKTPPTTAKTSLYYKSTSRASKTNTRN